MSSVGQPFEIQIRTEEMHKTAEYGIAAHWKYKESNDGKKSVAAQEEEKLSWLRQILEWQQDTDNREFLSLLKVRRRCLLLYAEWGCKESAEWFYAG